MELFQALSQTLFLVSETFSLLTPGPIKDSLWRRGTLLGWELYYDVRGEAAMCFYTTRKYKNMRNAQLFMTNAISYNKFIGHCHNIIKWDWFAQHTAHRDTDHLFSRPPPIPDPRSALYLHIHYIPLSTAVGIRPTMNRVFDCRSAVTWHQPSGLVA